VLDQKVGQVLEVKLLGKDGNVKTNVMDKIKKIINHPLSKSVFYGITGSIFLLEGKVFYSGIIFGIGIKELILAFKN